MLPFPHGFILIFVNIIVEAAAKEQGRLMARYTDTVVEHIIQPGISLNNRHRFTHQSAKTPLKVPQWTPATAPYHAAPGSGDGPAPWRGQHVYTPKSICSRCIQPTPTSSSTTAAPSACQDSTFWRKITETVTTCSGMVCAPTCLSLATALPQTVVDAMCVRTIQTTYTTKETDDEVETITAEPPQTTDLWEDGDVLVDRRRRELTTVVTSSVEVSACETITIQTPPLGSGVTLSSNGDPCYAITVTPTVEQSDTCTLDVHVTSYGPGVSTKEDGILTYYEGTEILDPVTSSGTTCTFDAFRSFATDRSTAPNLAIAHLITLPVIKFHIK